MKLREILYGIDVLDFSGDMDTDIEGICYDSRKASEGDVFICIKGFSSNGHEYASKAYEKGCRVFMVQDDIDVEGATVVKVENTRREMAKAASNFYNNPSKDIQLTGVTGTNGKTTITYLVKSSLESMGRDSGIVGTIKTYTGKRDVESERTTPESLELQQYFHEMVENGIDSCVMEVSSHSLELDRVCGCDFKYGIFTNLTPEHMDFHGDIESYMNAKEKLFHMTSKANIINIDDEWGRRIYENVKCAKAKRISYAIREKADIMAKDVKISSEGVKYTMVTPDYEIDIELSIPGEFSVYNSLAAAALLYAMEVPKEQIQMSIGLCKGVPGRFESISGNGGETVIVDYAHTPDALENILRAAGSFAKGRIITVFGCGGDRDTTKRPVMGGISQKYSDVSIVTSDNPRTEDPDRIINDVLGGMDTNAQDYQVEKEREIAIKKAVSMAKEGDVVVIAGKGHETYQIIGSEKIHFDDREIARKYLEVK